MWHCKPNCHSRTPFKACSSRLSRTAGDIWMSLEVASLAQRSAVTWWIADAILYLSSDRASGITGTELVVDGGYLATAEGPVD
jgi:enoyl-[acyl-carrier-protein] reductase (NADH)